MDCFDVAKDRLRWRALVNTVMKKRVPKDCGKRSYMLRHCDFTACFKSVYNLCCLGQNHRIMCSNRVQKQKSAVLKLPNQALSTVLSTLGRRLFILQLGALLFLQFRVGKWKTER